MISSNAFKRTVCASVCLGLTMLGSIPALGAASAGPASFARARESASGVSADQPRTASEAEELSAALPMSFEPNVGQADSRARFVARSRGYGVFLTDTEAVLSLPVSEPREQERMPSPTAKSADLSVDTHVSGTVAVRMRFDGASSAVRAISEDELPGKVNYLRGNDPEKWQRDVPTFARVRYENIYDGVDAVFYGSQQRLEYDVIVHPGADPSLVKVRFNGQDSAEITPDGDLVLKAGGGELRHLRPGVFQLEGAGKRPVAAKYELDGDGTIRFAVGEYDRSQPLVIDPGFEFSATLGSGTSDDRCSAVTTDASGAMVVAGHTDAIDFPVTPGAFDTSSSTYSSTDIFVAKLTPDGSSMTFATYLSGSYEDTATDIEIDAAGNVYVCGITNSTDFPTTPGAFDTTPGSGYQHGFVSKLNATGTALVYSSFVSGTNDDAVNALEVSSDGTCVIAGRTTSPDFPVTPGAYDISFNGQPYTPDAFVARINPTGTGLVFSTFFGGYGSDEVADVGLDATGVYVCGTTYSYVDFPITPGVFDTTFNTYNPDSGQSDVFVSKFDPTGASLVYSTFLGGYSTDTAASLAVVGGGEVVVAGTTDDQGFPRVAGSYISSAITYQAVFVTRLDSAAATLDYSALIGGSSYNTCGRLAVDSFGQVAVVGTTQSRNMPTTPGAFDREMSGESDGFLARLSAAGETLLYGTFLGTEADDACRDVSIDPSGRAVAVGFVSRDGFATTPGALDRLYGDGKDGYVFRLTQAGVVDYASYIGGSTSYSSYVFDEITDVVSDADGSIVVAGTTYGYAFPITDGAFDETIGEPPYSYYSVSLDGFVTRFSPAGDAILYSTYFGGQNVDRPSKVRIAPDGGIVLAGTTESLDCPTTPTGYSVTLAGYSDGFVAKLAPGGNALEFGTYLGGPDYDYVSAIAVDSAGGVVAAGSTSSPYFPTTPGAFDTSYNGYDSEDGFVSKFSPDGSSLTFSTLLGGSGGDYVNAIALDASGAVYAVGATGSPNFPTSPGAFSDTLSGTSGYISDAFAAKISSTGSTLLFGTYYGGMLTDSAMAVAVNAADSTVTIVGFTESVDFPLVAGAFDSTLGNGSGSGRDAFVVRLNATATSPVSATYLGGSGNEDGNAVFLDAQNRPTVAGTTESDDFPTSPDAADATLGDGQPYGRDAFAARLDAAGSSLQYGTFIGGSNEELGYAAAAAPGGSTIVVGRTASTDGFSSTFGSRDSYSGFIVRIGPSQPFAETSAGVYTPASGGWFLRNSNTPGPADMTFSYGPGGTFAPIVGDWDGDGDDTVGIYDTATGAFFLRNSNASGSADVVFTFGAGGPGVVALSGDWNGDGADTIGLYVIASGVFFLRNSNSSGPADVVFTFGAGGAGIAPIVGDWNGDGSDTIGLYVAGSGTFFLRNTNAPGGADLAFSYGPAGAVPVTGDWDGDGSDTIGICVPATGAWFLRNANSPGSADVVFSYGPAGATPIVGNWDGV